MDAITADYLIDLAVPPEGTTCPGQFEAGEARWGVAEAAAGGAL